MIRTVLALLPLCASFAAAQPREEAFAWPPAGREARPWSYWWWMGSAVDQANLTREMERYRKAGWGGMHIVPIYGARGYESRYIQYLSPRWMEMLRHTVAEGNRLDLGVDMTTGTGWCFGGPNVSPEHAAAVVTAKPVEAPAGREPAERFPKGSLQALIAVSARGEVADLTGKIAEDGAVRWTAEGGPWRLFALSQRPSILVKRAAPGGEGPMLNPFYGAAIRNYLERFTAAFAGYDGPRPRSMYHDSFEYRVDWSPDLLDEFARRRGYRLESEFPALFGGDGGDRAARVKSDYRETLAEMLRENFTVVWTEWCRRNGFRTRNQAHGSPGNLLDLYAEADIPETEMFNLDRSTVVSKFASSAAHVAGRRLVASETGTWLKEHFTETLADLKDLVDQFFVSGVNHVFYHGTCYSPDDASWPGWLFYASTEMNPRSAIWRDVPALNAYITRCQSMLQHGEPDNDILLYWPVHDVWHNAAGMTMNFGVHRREWLEEGAFGKLAALLGRRGFATDFVSDRQLQASRFERGRIRTPGASYAVVLSPPCERMPVATFERMLDLARSGATVVFEGRLPADVPGQGELESRRTQLKSLASSIALQDRDPGVREARLGAGRILAGDAEACLESAGVRRERLADFAGLEFIRRTSPAGAFYFVANRGSRLVEGWVPLAATAASAVLLDPMSGRSGLAETRRNGRGLDVWLQLEPGASIFVRTLARRPQGPAWKYWKAGDAAFPAGESWSVRFLEGGPELPPSFRTDRLASWTEAGEAAQRFAGTALYSTMFNAPALSAGRAWFLELGRVHESARVRLNGEDLGTVFTPPFRVLVERLRPEGNLLEVEVTNVSANRIRDLDRRKAPWKIFHDINFVGMDYKPFDASGWPVRESGLLGPVVVRPAVAVIPGK